MKKQVKILTGLLTFFIILSFIHLLIIDSYSINWDFHHVFFAGLYHLNIPLPPSLWQHLPFVDPDPRRMVETPFGPLQNMVPAFTWHIFYNQLKLLPFDSAWNLPAVITGAMGVLILFLFLKSIANLRTAWIGLIFLSLYPRYWGDMHTNVKDIPTAVFYTLSIYLAYLTVNTRKIIWVLTAGLITGITFNFKVNAIFIPVIVGLWCLWIIFTPAKKQLTNPISSWKKNVIAPYGFYFILSCFFAYGIWALIWPDPWTNFIYLIRFFQFNTTNMEVLLGGKWFCSGINVPWYYPFWYLTIVTPLPILFGFVIGIIKVLYEGFIRFKPFALLLILWFFVPLIRFMLPGASVIDGIRHYEEVIFPMIAISALGIETVFSKFSYHKTLKIFMFFIFLFFIFHLSWNIISYHPYQLSYYNELVGGIKGANGKYDIDYWGISQKQAVDWVNKNAPPNSFVHIIMTADTAGKYLRPDLLKNLNIKSFDESDYTIILNRQTFFYRYFFSWEYFLRRTPVYEVKVRGVPLSWVIDNKVPPVERRPNFWEGEDPCIRKYWE